MKFMTPYERPEKSYDPVGGPVLVETKGYISAQDRIENLILAGKRLVEGRAEQYDMEGEIDEDFNDPTRSKNFDMVDAQMLGEKASRGLKRAQDELKIKKDSSVADSVVKTKSDAPEKS